MQVTKAEIDFLVLNNKQYPKGIQFTVIWSREKQANIHFSEAVFFFFFPFQLNEKIKKCL